MNPPAFAPHRLHAMNRVLSTHIDEGRIPGLVAMVGRGDDLHVVELGSLAFGSGRPMRRDSLFRIASLTKLVTAVAAMALVWGLQTRLRASLSPTSRSGRLLLGFGAGLLLATIAQRMGIRHRDWTTHQPLRRRNRS